jgi:hypothetical protein
VALRKRCKEMREELGRYLGEVRAGQYRRLENLKSFDEFLERRFPESRRKAYYLMAWADIRRLAVVLVMSLANSEHQFATVEGLSVAAGSVALHSAEPHE